MSEAKHIWETLSAIDVNKHKKQKGKFDYLPWNFAWATLMEHYPSAIFRELPDQVHGDGSVTVHTEMEINGITREKLMHLFSNLDAIVRITILIERL